MEYKYMMTLLDKKSGKLNTYDIRTGEIISTDGVLMRNMQFGYSLEISDAICNLIREGKTIKEIANYENMPAITVIRRWATIHPDFQKSMQAAKRDRAEAHMDSAMMLLDKMHDHVDKQELEIQKFKFQGYLKLAEKDNPAMLVVPKQGGQAPLQIIVNTGIIREKNEITIEAEGQSINIERGQRISVDREGTADSSDTGEE